MGRPGGGESESYPKAETWTKLISIDLNLQGGNMFFFSLPQALMYLLATTLPRLLPNCYAHLLNLDFGWFWCISTPLNHANKPRIATILAWPRWPPFELQNPLLVLSQIRGGRWCPRQWSQQSMPSRDFWFSKLDCFENSCHSTNINNIMWH